MIINGPTVLPVGETATYSATITPPDASAPASVLWSTGDTPHKINLSRNEPGFYTMVITGTNCDGSSVVTDTLVVDVYTPCTPLSGVEITGPVSLAEGETGVHTLTLSPVDASRPIAILWSNGMTGTLASYSWDEPGLYAVRVTASNFGGSVSDTVQVDVFQTSFPLWMPLILRTQTKWKYNSG